MDNIVMSLIPGLLGFATGIFTVLSLIEKPTWKLMRDSRSEAVADDEVRAVHAILKRLIHLLPPTMITTMLTVTLLLIILLFQTNFSTEAIIVAAVNFVQHGLIILRLRRDIRGVDGVASDAEIEAVRDGLANLEVAHHRGLLMASSTLIAFWVLLA